MSRARRFHTIICAPRGEAEAVGYVTWQISVLEASSLTTAKEIVRTLMTRCGYPPESYEWV